MNVCALYDGVLMHGAQLILDKVTLEIGERDRIAIVGRNGSGKTTLLRVLAGQLPIATGRIYWKKDLKTALLDQIPDLSGEILVEDVLRKAFEEVHKMRVEMETLEVALAENHRDQKRILERYGYLQEEFAALGGFEVDARIRRIASGLNLTGLLSQKWKELSGGERTRVGLGLTLLRQPGLLLLDEPTNHLDLAAADWLTDFVRNYPGAVVMVSHDRYFLDQVVQKILEIEEGSANLYHQNYSGYRQEKEERLLIEFQKYQDQQKKIKKMKEAIKRLRDWANRSKPPSEALHRRASSMEKAMERITLVARPTMSAKPMGLSLNTDTRSSDRVVTLEDVSISFGEQPLLVQVHLEVRNGERVALVGNNGSGKSTLLKIMLKQLDPTAGKVLQGASLSVGYLSQHGEELRMGSTVLDEFRQTVGVSEAEARHILARFLFFGEKVFQSTDTLSGGERMRLLWARMMFQRHNVLVLDEPTNHMDLESREVLEEALADFPGTVVVVSHDRYLLDRYFTTTYWLSDGQVMRYEGNYSYAAAKRTTL